MSISVQKTGAVCFAIGTGFGARFCAGVLAGNGFGARFCGKATGDGPGCGLGGIGDGKTFIGMTFCAGGAGGEAVPFDCGAGLIAGARLFQRGFGLKPGGSGIFLTGASGIRGDGALIRRSAGLGGETTSGGGWASA